ncbi:hypothetical protein Tco_0706853 [Tanacetum coccineum]|uniref:Uncharacterized protein n=1 Tax=Tanacetum coccineum TaxID=301880 RepID=A0ABQ4Y9I1_9ASTR
MVEGDVEEVDDLSLEALEDEEVAMVDGVFKGAFGALDDESWCLGLEVEALVDDMEQSALSLEEKIITLLRSGRDVVCMVRILQKLQENGQSRTNMDTGTELTSKDNMAELYVTKASHWWKPTRRDMVALKEAHGEMDFCTKRLTKEAQVTIPKASNKLSSAL